MYRNKFTAFTFEYSSLAVTSDISMSGSITAFMSSENALDINTSGRIKGGFH